MWFSRRQKSSWTRGRSARRGVFGGRMKSKEEIEKLAEHIDSQEEIEKKKADIELENEWKEIE